ncbi:DUF4652 domain-containing protein [Bacillus benzoevorans]|uniref:DUF4652 domain-containing protein n=1 Tax=Bacillus benzoevorans TaxID=1456 RepID=A0A7X0LWT4_9BACI|nr:DUF4652 domain-containing protein [Bacillus benzoevorans]MBB6447416.1 hypothetical protein [Bacillus benzoevorans]
MKKYILLILLAAILVLGACANGAEVTEDKKSEEIQTEEKVKSDSETADKTEAKEELEQQEENADKAETSETDGFDIKYNTEEKSVQLVKADGNTEVLAARSASEPVKSPDRKKAAYVSPIEWEEPGDVYIVNLEDGTQNVLVATEGEQTPKKVIWENNENVLVIIGYAYGTVATGGNIYRVNLETKEKTALTQYEGDVQITDLKIENGILKYSGIKYTDDNFNESVPYSNKLPLASQ